MRSLSGISGCLAAALAIALGAFGAHALKETLETSGRTYVWQTAVDYHMWHALALVLCALIHSESKLKTAAVALFAAGIVLFSGSLYWLALGGPGWLGPITPLGGLSFMIGWICLAVGFIAEKQPDSA